MSNAPFDVRFVPERRVFAASGPVELYLAAAAVGIMVEQPCGSQGTCGRCRVRVTDGAPPPTDADRAVLGLDEIDDGWRLGCQLVFDGPATVEVPLVARSQAGKSFGGDLPPAALERPAVAVATVPRPRAAPGGGDASLVDAVASSLGLPERSLRASPSALAELASAGSGTDHATAAVLDGELISARAGGAAPLGLAVDLGTTSLAAALVSLSDGAVLASASSLNPQVAFGADVISRIRHAIEVPDGAAHLASAARGGLSDLVEELVRDAGCTGADIVVAAVAGNPTMMHAWLGVPMGGLGRAPYAGVWTDALTLKAREVGLPVHPNAVVQVFPLVRSHVGGDAVAAAIACDLDGGTAPRLLVDLGTNSEVLVASGGRMAATSAAAGPAFEGVSVRHGMRGSPGAIDVVSISAAGAVSTSTIGGLPARGVCGSGLIDAVAEMLRAGIVTPAGYMRRVGEVPGGVRFDGRLGPFEERQAFTLVPAHEAADDVGPIAVTARDVREVQVAKGSIVAAVALLCRHLGIEPGDLDESLVAGAFGNYVRKSSALRIGLVPPIDAERIRFVGNAAGVGARLALVDRDILARGRRLAARIEYVDLATHASYQDVFMAALAFPPA